MKLAVALLMLITGASAAAGQSVHSDWSRPFDRRMAQLPETDADLDRASHAAPHAHNFADDIARDLNIRDGKAQLFDARDFGPVGGELSGSLDAHGASLRLRW